MYTKRRSYWSRFLFAIVVFSLIDNAQIAKIRATIAEEVVAAGLVTAGLFRAVAVASAAVIRAFKNYNTTPVAYRSGAQDTYARPAEPSVSANQRSVQAPVANTRVTPEYSALPINTISPNISNNSAFIAQAYVNSLSEKDRIAAEQAARTITASWRDSVRSDITQAMGSTNYYTNQLIPDIAQWNQPTYTVQRQPGGGSVRFCDGAGYVKWGDAAHRRADRTASLQKISIDEDRYDINHNQQLYLHVKQVIHNFVENGRKLVYGSLAERIIALLNLPYFYVPGISYGHELYHAQKELYACYFHEDDGRICLDALENTKQAQKILRDYQGINNSHKYLFYGDCFNSYKPSCDKPNAMHWVGKLPEDMASRITNCENNKKLIRMLEAFASGDMAKATKAYQENSTGVHGSGILFDAFRDNYETAVKKQEALLKDTFGIYHFGVPIGQQDPVFTGLSGPERQALGRDTNQLKALNDYLVTRHQAKSTLHNLWQIPTSVSPAVHRALYNLLDACTPESRIDKIYEFSQNAQVSDNQKQEIVQVLHLPNGVVKDFAEHSRAKTINIPAIILLPEHAYTRKILNHLIYTEQASKDEPIKQSSARTIEQIQDFLQQKIDTNQFVCDWQELEQKQQEQVIFDQNIRADSGQVCECIHAYRQAIERNECSEEQAIRWNKRIQAMELTLSDNYACSMMPPTEPPSDIIIRLLRACQHIKDKLINSNLTAIQRCIQQEIIEILGKMTDWCRGRHNILSRTIHELLHIATDFNNAGSIYKALLVTDCCWALLNCLPDIALGVHDGVRNLIRTGIHAAQNPKDTAIAAKENMKNAAWHVAILLHKICGITVQCAINDKKGWERAYAAGYNIYRVTKALMTKMGEMSVREKASLATGELVKSMITKRCLTTLLRFYSTAGNKLESCVKSAKNGPTPPSCSQMTMLAAHAADRTSAFSAIAAATQAEGSTVVSAATTVGEQVTKRSLKLPSRVSHILYNERELLGLFVRNTNIAPIKQYANILKFSHVQFTPRSLRHICGIEIKEMFKKSGNIATSIKGFHHDLKNKLNKYLRNIVVHPKTGVMQADIHFMDIVKRENTLFPSKWTRDKMIKSLKEAIANQIKEPKMQSNGNWLLTGITRDKIEVELVVMATGELITAYPLFSL